MADAYTVVNIAGALQERLYPTVTLWNRLEGRPRRTNFSRAMRAEIRDPLFMLTRQWQMGEFRGDDAGSPAAAKLQVSTTALRTYRAASGGVQPFDDGLPLEARVERRPLPLTIEGADASLDLRLLMGRQWLRMVAPIANYGAAFAARHPIRQPDPTRDEEAAICAHPEAWQMVAAVAGRCLDGAALYSYLAGNAQRRAWDGVSGVLDVHKPAIDDAATRFVRWVDALITVPAGTESAWLPDRLEYQFAAAAPEAAAETVFAADEYFHGRIDWYNFDVNRTRATLGTPAAAAADPQASTVQALVPTPLSYEGMPNTRWWAFEERRVNLGTVTPATTDVGTLMFLEFSLVYANDWFLFPIALSAGSLARVRGLAITTVFGERFWITAAGAGPDDAWQRWSMFTVSARASEPGGLADTSLMLLPTPPKIQDGRPLEQVVLLRDEIANMVWGVEKTIPLVTGRDKSGSEAAAETLAYHQRLLDQRLASTVQPAVPDPVAPVRYQIMNTVPEHWIPFIPVHVSGDNRATQLQRAALPRILEGDRNPPDRVRPRTVLLRDGLEELPRRAYYLHEEEVPRAGAVVAQGYRRARWSNGRVVVWLGIQKQNGRGEGSGGLAFDRLIQVPTSPPSS